MEQTFETIRYEVDGAVATVTMTAATLIVLMNAPYANASPHLENTVYTPCPRSETNPSS